MELIKNHINSIEAVLSADPSVRSTLSGRISLKFTGENIDSYVISPFKPHVTPNGTEFDAEVQLSSDMYKKIISGKLNPQKAFADAKIKVFGDTMLILSASSILFEEQ